MGKPNSGNAGPVAKRTIGRRGRRSHWVAPPGRLKKSELERLRRTLEEAQELIENDDDLRAAPAVRPLRKVLTSLTQVAEVLFPQEHLIEFGSHSGTFRIDGVALELPRAEATVFRALLQMPGEVVSVEAIARMMSGAAADPVSRCIPVYVSNIRRKLERLIGHRKIFDNVPGVGWRLNDCITPKQRLC
jgi:DNA-binding response OmpR family regulator